MHIYCYKRVSSRGFYARSICEDLATDGGSTSYSIRWEGWNKGNTLLNYNDNNNFIVPTKLFKTFPVLVGSWCPSFTPPPSCLYYCYILLNFISSYICMKYLSLDVSNQQLINRPILYIFSPNTATTLVQDQGFHIITWPHPYHEAIFSLSPEDVLFRAMVTVTSTNEFVGFYSVWYKR
jgi:hypothetical protein